MSEEHNIKDDEFIIPIDAYIQDFRTHLESHPRTIFSAKFGDGKSYFLNKIQEDELFADYTFLTIHPINYQVESNKDIFELVKRDILLQMIANDMIDAGYEIPDSVAIQFFVQNNVSTVAEFFISSLGKLNADSKLYSAFTAGYKTCSFVDKLKAKLQEYKNRGSDEEFMEKFFIETDNIPSVEYDAISKIISQNIKKYQEENNKKVVLIFEDMDRIDPAHLFRIMNVLSAQMDLPYITKENPNDTLNKYGFDNIVLVLDYDNLIKIFHHFYGADTNFYGYINKFSPRGRFNYSLKNIRLEYMYNEISRIGDFDEDCVKSLVPDQIIETINLRKFVDSFNDLDKQIIKYEYPDVHGNLLKLDNFMIRLIVFLCRIGIDKDTINSTIAEYIHKDINRVKLFPYYFIKEKFSNGQAIVIY